MFSVFQNDDESTTAWCPVRFADQCREIGLGSPSRLAFACNAFGKRTPTVSAKMIVQDWPNAKRGPGSEYQSLMRLLGIDVQYCATGARSNGRLTPNYGLALPMLTAGDLGTYREALTPDIVWHGDASVAAAELHTEPMRPLGRPAKNRQLRSGPANWAAIQRAFLYAMRHRIETGREQRVDGRVPLKAEELPSVETVCHWALNWAAHFRINTLPAFGRKPFVVRAMELGTFAARNIQAVPTDRRTDAA